ncbi:peptidoglycan DD-metalloendopeptidase family protein [Motilimonas cestriensis]|uniref:Peptidoglycan DD-metalloendopeptidase family protein n=1 Tax=Motilimonas cestriensis TaxID=2742685 RepID=A0ABS8W6U7_9GAMM|nr:peptidoglycan DD-metalloendopeptidase family protein [Motilimonas cestriensis]
MAIFIIATLFLLFVIAWPSDKPSLTTEPMVKPIALDMDRILQQQTDTVAQDPNEVIKAHAEFPDMSGVSEHFVTLQPGDTVGKFLSELNVYSALPELLVADEKDLRLGNVMPGQTLNITLDAEGRLSKLVLGIDIANKLTFTATDDGYSAELFTEPGEWSERVIAGDIHGSFNISANKNSLSMSSITHIAKLLENRLKFRNLRAGDKYYVVVNEQRVKGEFYQDEVLGVIIKSRSNTYSAFLHDDGNYYDQAGSGLNKAYRKSPLNGKFRLSSHFNLKRKHPVTGKIRPHYGTDWAAPIGTPVYSIGDGVVERVENHPLAGKYLVLKHGRQYTTRYLHLSKILVRKGERVSMGQLVAKTGNTGRSTGAHLHFEFHINGRRVNPLKVKLPYSTEMDAANLKRFKANVLKMKKQMGV